jgi:integrase
MAVITQRENGKWQAKIRRQGTPAQSKTFVTKADAEKWARSVERDIDTGSFIPTDDAARLTFAAATERYRREVLPNLRGRMQVETRLTRLLEAFGKYSLSSISGAMVASYRDERLRSVSPQTVVHELGQIQQIFKRATHEWGIQLPRGLPTLLVSKPRLPPGRDRRLEAGEEALLLDQASQLTQPWVRAIIILATETAGRQSELLSLTWSQVDLQRRVARLFGKDGAVTKNGTPFRDVPLSSRAIATLEELPRNLKGPVFPISQNALQLSWERLCKSARKKHLLTRLRSMLEGDGMSAEEAEREVKALVFKKRVPTSLTTSHWAELQLHDKMLTDLHFHDLRHEATSRLADRLQLHELMKVTGHKTSAMVSRYYHPRAEDLAAKLA